MDTVHMRMLLTSGGVRNARIREALVRLLGKPIEDASALIVPTAAYPMSDGTAASWRVISGTARTPIAELGWSALGVLELTALPDLPRESWVPALERADALLVAGGDPLFLAHWIRRSGLAELLPTLRDTVWVGVSAGSMVMAPRIGDDFAEWRPPGAPSDAALGIVDFAIFPHLDHPALPDNTLASAERWAADLGTPAYAIDDDTAIVVVDDGDDVEIVSEGAWRRFEPKERVA